MDQMQQTAPQTPKSRNGLAIILSVVITALVVGGGVFVLQRRMADSERGDLQARVDQLQSDLRDAKASTNTATNTTTNTTSNTTTNTDNTTSGTSETANWKTYSNTTYGFSVKYPPTLIADFSAANKMLSIYDPTKARPNTVLTVDVAASSKTLDQFLAALKADALVSSEKKITLDGVEVYEGIDKGIISQYGIYAVNNGTEFTLRLMSNNKDTLSDLKAGLSSTQEAMIASFGFTK